MLFKGKSLPELRFPGGIDSLRPLPRLLLGLFRRGHIDEANEARRG
ncbi:MAG: hypothetical protein RL417_2605, partial [Pseudomonadota bacterium]